jgi:hypothetical protein
MKNIYISIALFIISLTGFAQSYEFGIVHNSGYNFSVIAIPYFDATNTDVSDIGFTLMLPTGSVDVTNITQFNGRAWTATEVTATQLTNLGLGDGTRDGFLMNLPPGQTMLSHTNGQQIVLVTFDVSNMPTMGQIELLLNSDPIATGLGGALDSFYNSNINATTTQDYFTGIISGMGSFMFSTLGVTEIELTDIQLKIYPNPATDIIHITSNMELIKIELFDILGKRVLTSTETQELKVDHLKAGVYFVKVYSSKGPMTKKIIVND